MQGGARFHEGLGYARDHCCLAKKLKVNKHLVLKLKVNKRTSRSLAVQCGAVTI